MAGSAMTATLDDDRAMASLEFVTSSSVDVSLNPRASQARSRAMSIFVVGAVIALTLTVELAGSFLLQQRAQRQLLSEFSATLNTAASAYGQDGISPLPDTAPTLGSAVALLQIPALGISQVVIEGNSSRATQSGPAHIPGTALPGQSGEAIIVGHRTTFGAPFFHLNRLKPGDSIKVVTLEGPSTYKVVDSQSAISTPPTNRLMLRTSNPVILGTGTLEVIAELQGKPYVATPKNSSVVPTSSSLPLVLLLLIAIYALVRVIPLVHSTFGSLVSWLLVAPAGLAFVVALALALDSLLPATL